MRKDELAKDTYDAIQNCARDLPFGWQIEFAIERGSGVVILWDPSGDEVEYPSNHEYMHQSFEDALEYAIEMDKKMGNDEILEFLQKDLINERHHMLFYLQAASIVTGLHREEYKELFLKEAQSELIHVHEFATAIVYLGGDPSTTMPLLTFDERPHPINLLEYAISIEETVAENYKNRLAETEAMSTPAEAWIHLFYEDQLQDSWKAAQEMKKMLE